MLPGMHGVQKRKERSQIKVWFHMESHIQRDHLQGSEEEITPEFISLWGKGDGLLYSPHRPWLQNTLCFEERAIKLSATSGSSLDLLLFSRVSLRSSMCWLSTTKHMEAKWWVERCEKIDLMNLSWVPTKFYY